jgi:hypothetical protein
LYRSGGTRGGSAALQHAAGEVPEARRDSDHEPAEWTDPVDDEKEPVGVPGIFSCHEAAIDHRADGDCEELDA